MRSTTEENSPLVDSSDRHSTRSYNTVTDNVASPFETDKRIGVSLATLTLCLAIGSCLPGLDTSIVYTAMSRIGTDFESSNQIAWIQSSYTLCSLITLPIAGKLSDIVGRRPVLLTLTTLFFIGSVGCGYASDLTQMIVFRAIAGLGGGGLNLLGNVVIHDVVPADQRNRYLSYISTVQTIGFPLGSPLGGFITDTLGWRYCFKINIVPLLLLLYVYTFHLKSYKVAGQSQRSLRMIDFPGIAMLAGGNILLAVTLLMGGNIRAWSDPIIIGSAITSFGFYVVFTLYQAKWAKYPLVSRVARSNYNVVGSCLIILLTGAGEAAFLIMIPQFCQGVMHTSAGGAGVWVMIEAVAVPVGCFAAGKIIGYTSGRFYKHLLLSALLYSLSLIGVAEWMATRITSLMVAGLFVLAEGYTYGALLVSLYTAVASDLPSEEVASAMSMVMMARYMGYLVGVASCSAIVQGSLKMILSNRLSGPDAAELVEFIRTSIGKVSSLRPEIQEMVAQALATSLERAGWVAAAVTATAILIAIRMKDVNNIKSTD